MTHIVRLFGSQENTDAAIAALKSRGFVDEHIKVLTASETVEGTQDAIMRAGVAKPHAVILAKRVQGGETLLKVNPPFGFARVAMALTEDHGPLPVSLPPIEERTGIDGRDAAPLSETFGWRVLSSDPAPLSHWLNWQTVKPENKNSATLRSIRRQSQNPAPLSRALGLPLLSRNPAPLSRLLAWSLLSRKAAPLSDSVGWPTLWGAAAPLSKWAGWSLISKDPAPLSNALGFPVLTRRQ